ncbi:P-loop containing nucleoside triphosphate hydrolase protein, partial [Mycena maculata]
PISMLPSEPNIFHGRDSEVSDIINAFAKGTPKIAILGAGGMGKTCLARAVLHHPTITTQYQQHRVFVACDSVSTAGDVVALIRSYVGLKPGKDLTRPIIQYFSSGPASLLILDNLETIWEGAQNRRAIEEFSSDLTEIQHLALIITMRGAERPAKVHWTRPFLPPLQPLSHNAAHQTFIDIAEDHHDPKDIDKILFITDNMPLPIDLIAHLVDGEGCPTILARWKIEKTALLSDGHDQRSNLEISISLSLASPRIVALPDARSLLGLLSMLPDGL